MKVLSARNVHQALPLGLDSLIREGVTESSRNGDVLVYPTPVTTVYSSPTERCIFHKERVFNPFFFLMESLWMLSGRDDTAWLVRFNKQMQSYSDDGTRFHGAYGYRWRKFFDMDQLDYIVDLLNNKPNSRRAVLQIWNCTSDLNTDESGKDMPCNLLVTFRMNNGSLDITVMNRSNDVIWGAYGANAVHFSFLQEYMAGRLGVQVGKYYQISNNFHVYKEILDKFSGIVIHAPDPYRTVPRCPYSNGTVKPYKFMTNPNRWDQDLATFMDEDFGYSYWNPFFLEVAIPMYKAHWFWRDRDTKNRYDKAYKEINVMPDCDWKFSAEQWLTTQEEILLKNR